MTEFEPPYFRDVSEEEYTSGHDGQYEEEKTPLSAFGNEQNTNSQRQIDAAMDDLTPSEVDNNKGE